MLHRDLFVDYILYLKNICKVTKIVVTKELSGVKSAVFSSDLQSA